MSSRTLGRQGVTGETGAAETLMAWRCWRPLGTLGRQGVTGETGAAETSGTARDDR
jgi:hypothetical protein